MSTSTTARDILLALLLSLAATLLLAVVYVLYPLISAMVSVLLSSREGAGSGRIVAVAGGIGEPLLWAALVAEPVVFLITFALLRRRRAPS